MVECFYKLFFDSYYLARVYLKADISVCLWDTSGGPEAWGRIPIQTLADIKRIMRGEVSYVTMEWRMAAEVEK